MRIRSIIKGILIAVCVFMSTIQMRGETISQKQAMGVAQTFFNALYGEVTAPPRMVWNGRQLTTSRLFAPFYVYNSSKGGFVIISAENKAFPILAYSKDASFRRESLGEEENEWLKKFAREIELVRYDSREPSQAIDAWGNMSQYIAGLISNPYGEGRLNLLSEDDKELLEQIDRRNSWVLMPSGVEYEIYDPEKYRNITLDDVLAEEEEEYVPFSFYEDFLDLVKKEAEARQMEFDNRLNPVEASVRPFGGGHFEIFIPEGAIMMRLYNMQGGMNIEKYYSGTTTINVNIEHMPPGFYIGLVLSETGEVNSFKLWR